MAKQTNVSVINETGVEGVENWSLCLQWCLYVYPDKPAQYGYRFIWRRPDGTLQAARGQARVPSLALMSRLMHQATEAGWGTNVAADEANYMTLR